MRQLKREVKIGNVTIGGKNPVADDAQRAGGGH